ncbi:3-coathanger stack domain-containing protein [Emticicia sp. W12TSBA100-4]|uniref:3-coathanger stack domain-containing protein n=1 Tax=Emticicia sp. W12TSBA100-4 TaxID=3160965 RepID=UPI0033062807
MMNRILLLLLTLVYVDTFGQKAPSNIITGKLVRVSPKLKDIKAPEALDTKRKPDRNPKYQALRDKINKRVRFAVENPLAKNTDEALQKTTKINFNNLSTKALSTSFDGVGTPDNSTAGFGLLSPPDPVLSVGPNHVVQMINLVHRVYDKSGNPLTPALKFSQIASTSTDDGDPITLYDHMADRWILLQFSSLFTSGRESLIFCVSQTNDPTGAYNIYEFLTTGVFPDYPHVGIWNNSYIVTTHNFNQSGTAYLGQGYWAFDRSKMLNGESTANGVGFNDATTGGYLPASFEGFKTPEISSQPTFVTFNADEFGGSDELQLRTLTPNFSNPALSTLSSVTSIPVAAFNGNSPSSNPIEQQGTAVRLDAIADRMMSRIIYRRFDDYESLVMNHVVNVSGESPTSAATYQAATRWYELTRASPSSPWVVNQQSTYSPTAISGTAGINRWMGCAGIDQRGNIALAYSRSSSTNYPDIYYAERKKTDPVGTLGAEQLFHASGGSQTNSNGRWGDYSAMTTDPADEETLWFTAEYYATTANVDFKTRIGSFKVNDPVTTPTVHFKFGGTIARQKESITPLNANQYYKDYPITVVIDQVPSQDVNIEITKTGTATEGVDYDLLNISPIVLNTSNLTQSFILRVYDDSFNEADEFIDLAYTINANGGNAIAGTFNQKHRITIIGTISCPTANISVTRPTTFCEGDSAILVANTGANLTYQWYRNNVLITDAIQSQYNAKTSGSYQVAVSRLGCTVSSSPIVIIVKVGTPPPVTVSRTITVGTIITAGNGLQANAICPSTTTTTYTGTTIGYDGGTKSGVDPQVLVSGAGPSIGSTKISVTWRKRSGGTIIDCGTVGGTGRPYYDEVSFKIKAPDGTIVNLVNTDTYAIGVVPLGVLTTVFEDGGSALTVGSLPANGTFSPAQSLAAFNGLNPNGTWTLIAEDAASIDPLCVEGFSVTVLTSGSGAASTISWYSSATGGTSLGTGSEYIPTDTAPGVYTYYAEASCSGLTECATSVRKPARLTISSLNCLSAGGSVSSDANVCAGSNSGVLTLNGHTGTIIRWESSTDNFVNTTLISNTNNTLSYSNLTQTTKYRAVVKDGECPEANSSAATITVTTITPIATNNGPYLTGQTIQLTATGGSTYTWTGPNAFSSTLNPASIANATLAMAGIYTVTVTQNSCTATATTSVIITENNPCLAIVEYDYVQAGNPFIFKFPLLNNMVIAEVPEQTSVLVNPICPNILIESFRMRITGLPYLHEVIESIAPFALFNNTGNDVLGRNLGPGNYKLTVTGYSQDNAMGSIVYGPIETDFTVVANNASISAPTFTLNSLCAGSTFNVSFTTTGAFNPANQFDVQLSDANGTFDNPVIIGSTPAAGVAVCTIPINIAVGSNYRIRVVSTNQMLAGGNNGSNLSSVTATLNLVSPNNDISGGVTTNQASQTITATNKVLSPGNTIYKAGNSILLNAGFQANSSSVFKAEIAGCN